MYILLYIVMEKINKYYCNSCNKKYKSYKTFWYHNKTQHQIINDNDILDYTSEIREKPENTLDQPGKNLNLTENDIVGIKEKKYICEYCNKKFTRIDNMHVHQSSSCKKKEAIIKENEMLKEALSEIASLKELLFLWGLKIIDFQSYP